MILKAYVQTLRKQIFECSNRAQNACKYKYDGGWDIYATKGMFKLYHTYAGILYEHKLSSTKIF